MADAARFAGKAGDVWPESGWLECPAKRRAYPTLKGLPVSMPTVIRRHNDTRRKVHVDPTKDTFVHQVRARSCTPDDHSRLYAHNSAASLLRCWSMRHVERGWMWFCPSSFGAFFGLLRAFGMLV